MSRPRVTREMLSFGDESLEFYVLETDSPAPTLEEAFQILSDEPDVYFDDIEDEIAV